MLYFHNDYNEICHPAVMDRLASLSGQQKQGYAMDDCCADAAAMIRRLCDREDLAVHFLTGGTQANLTVIAAALRPHQAVLGADTAHVNVHETGAIEATGHKVISLPSADGKITAQQVVQAVRSQRESADAEHFAQPKLVYISNPTELGTIYTLAELDALAAVCREYGLYLFMDGARLGYGLAAADNDVTLADLACLCDVFYIGGTKVGAMFGEAVVIANPHIAEDFRYLIKQRGGMLAKGWLLGAQFEALLENGLYFEISAHADRLADQLRQTIDELGYSYITATTTNQIFPILPDAVLAELGKEFTFAEMHRVDEGHRAVRFCTSWATKPENVEALCAALKKLKNS